MWRVSGLRHNMCHDNDTTASRPKKRSSTRATVSNRYVCNTSSGLIKLIFIVALEQRLSSEGLEDTGEDDFIRFPDETNNFPDQSFPDLVNAYSQDGFEKEAPNSSSTNGFGVDVVFSQPGSTMTIPLAGLSPISFISDLMRSDL